MTTKAKDVDRPVDKVKIVMKTAVGWFSVKLLIMTGIQALITTLFGSRSARREILAALDSQGRASSLDYNHGGVRPAHFDYQSDANYGTKEIWIDYVADLGDGFNGTHSVSWLLGRDYLFLKNSGAPVPQPIPQDSFSEAKKDDVQGADYVLPCGNIMIFGGDQVYPAASQRDYQDRTIGPYYAARPWSDRNPAGPNDNGRRSLFSIPGNHDWYDGLNSFIKNFCQPGRWIGCWQVQQRRSYFSLCLPHGFWIWGLDLATDDDIDPPQMEYFTEQACLLEDNDQVILCVPKPAWLDLDQSLEKMSNHKSDSWDAWSKISTVLDLITSKDSSNNRVPLIIAGDNHYYAHHKGESREANDDSHFIICGGGGAFTLGTATVPTDLKVSDNLTAHHSVSFPSKEASVAKRLGVFKLFYRHKFFCILLSSIVLALVWLIHISSLSLIDPSTIPTGSNLGKIGSTLISGPFLETAGSALASWSNFRTLLQDLVTILVYRPSVLVFTLALILGFGTFANSAKSPKTQVWAIWPMGFLHFVFQLVIALSIAAGLWALMAKTELILVNRLLIYILVDISLGWLCHGLFLSLYMWVSNVIFKMHEQELYSSQSIEDWKSFLRMKIDSKGLTIFPIGLRNSSYDWEAAPHPGSFKCAERTDKFYDGNLGKSWVAEVPEGTTHLFQPTKPLASQLL